MATTPDDDLRNRLRGKPGVSPEDTHSELLAAVNEKLKTQEAESIRRAKDVARAWTEKTAKAQAAIDVADHANIVARGKRGADVYLLHNMVMQASVNPAYDAALKSVAPDLYVMAFHAVATQDKAKPVDVAEQSQATAVEQGLKDQLEDENRRRKARDLAFAGSVDVQRSGQELERGEFIMPRRITQAYTEVDGKFFAKDSNRVMFEDKGEKLATSTTNREAIADMVAYAKAKQWNSLKLSGSQDFRREAWLQAESQGIKTQGYTPKQNDLAALEALRQERSTNSITPLQERPERKAPREESSQAAPRHDINKNQAAMHVEANKCITTNMEALQKQPGMADKSAEELTQLAYWRGIVAEENKLQPKPVQDEAIARFDKQATDPQFLKRLNQETNAKIQDKTTDRVRHRDEQEQSL